MKSVRFAGLFVFLVGTVLYAQTNPVPLINQPLVPASAASGGASFTLTVNGAGFVSSSAIEWNGVPLLTSVVSDKKLTAKITATQIAHAGTASVTVVNPGAAASNVAFFPIAPPESVVCLLRSAKGLQGAHRDLDGFVPAPAHRASRPIQDGAQRLVPNCSRHVLFS